MSEKLILMILSIELGNDFDAQYKDRIAKNICYKMAHRDLKNQFPNLN